MTEKNEKKIINNKEEKPLRFYLEEYAGIEPEKRAEALGIDYHEGSFFLEMLGESYQISWPEGDISSQNERALALSSNEEKIMLYRYLVHGQAIPASGGYKTFRELPWGEVYIKTFSGRCLARLAFKFSSRLNEYREAAKALGGEPMTHSDAGFEFGFTGDYRLRVFIWQGDEEFPPSAQILYTDNFAVGFSAEDSVVAAELLINALSEKVKQK